MYTMQGKTRPTRHTLSTLSPRITLNHTYLTRSTYSILSQCHQQSWTKSLLSRKRNSWLHPQHADWLICESPSSFSLPHNQWVGDIVRNSCFSGPVRSVQIYWWIVKGCYTWTTWDMYGREPYADWAWKACGVLVRFSPVGCTLIWIAATLRYEYCLFFVVNLMNLMSLMEMLLCFFNILNCLQSLVWLV
jgi:hypothetical protein